MAELTRRRLLAAAASSAAIATAAGLLPPNVRREVVAPPPTRRASLRDIKHVVLLMQENRSFDHYFGTLAGVRGFGDASALRLPEGGSVFYQPDPVNPAGYLLPFHLDTRTTSAQKIPSTSHAWDVQHDSWNGGKMDNWLPAHRKADGGNAPYVMGYHTRADIPLPVRARRGVHHLRRLPLLGDGPDLAEPHVLDDRHDRRRRRRRRARVSNNRPKRRLPLDHLRRAAREGGRQLEGLPAAGQLRLQHAGVLQARSEAPPRVAALHVDGMMREPRASSSTTP